MTARLPLAIAFGAITPAPPPATPDELEARLREALDAARRAFPEVAVPDEAFATHAARQVGAGASLDEVLAPERAPDLYLALACARGDARALAIFDRRHVERVPAYLAHLRPTADLVDETRQALREKLLMGRDGGAPKIAQYSGRGDLDHFVCVAAIRVALSLLRKIRPAETLTDERAAVASLDPELRFIEARHREAFAVAFREALGELSSRDRTLLRLHYLKRLPMVHIARAWGAHRTTVARWLEDACRATLEATRRRLRERLSLSPSECDSVLRAVESRLDVAIPSLLRHTTAG